MTESAVPASVRRAVDAANANDTDAFIACFAADGAVDDWGRVFHGADEIRGWSDREFIGKQVSLDVTGTATTSDGTVVSAQVDGNGFNGPSDFTFTVTDEA